MAAAAEFGLALTAVMEALVLTLDRASHALAIPPRAAQAADTLAALGLAWTYNGQGMSCPPELKRKLT